jgi:hypothetical protein
MSNFFEKKRIPFPILFMSVFTGALILRMVFDWPPVTVYERGLLQWLILILLLIISFYFILRKPIEKIRENRLRIKRDKFFDSNEITAQVPDDFILEIVKEKGFSFCYPKTWFMTTPGDPALYKEVREQMVDPGIKGARNFNISVHDIRLAPDLEKMFQAIIDGVLNALKGAKLEFKQKFKTDQFIGMRYKVVYRNTQGLDLACYQVVMTNQYRCNMLIFTFTSQISDFEKSKPLFDQIAGLAKIFD